MDERRKFPRIPAAAVVEIAQASSASDEKRIAVESLDISAGGIAFSSDRSFEVGSRWELALRLDESLWLNPDWHADAEGNVDFPVVTALCEIVRVKGSEEIGYVVAVRFIRINDKDATVLQKFLAEL